MAQLCRSIHAILAAAAPTNPGFQTVIFPGSPGYALYPSAQVPRGDPIASRAESARGDLFLPAELTLFGAPGRATQDVRGVHMFAHYGAEALQVGRHFAAAAANTDDDTLWHV